MATSQVPVIKAKLIEVLTNATPLVDVAIMYQRKPDPPREFVCITDVTSWTFEWANLGPQAQLDETFSLTTYISARKAAQEQQEATERCFEIFAEVERLVRADFIRITGLHETLWAIAMKPTDFDEMTLIDGQAALIEASIECHTRI